MSSEGPIDLTVDPKDHLPQVILDEWLPSEEESILFLFQHFSQYPPCPSNYILPSNLQSVLHQDTIQTFNYQSLLHIGPPALPTVPKAYQDAINKSVHPIGSVTLIPCDGDPVRLPVWVFDYWIEIGRAVDTRKQWKVSLTWVQRHSTSPSARELCYELLLGLCSFSWSQGAAYTHDITSLLSDTPEESYLSSFHIDHMIAWTRAQHKTQHGPDSTNHIFATVDHFNAILHFYGNVRTKKEGSLWDSLMVIENKIIMGEADSFGGVMHLPSHWVSVIINCQKLQILYGDSLGHEMPRRERLAFEHWIQHLINRSTKFPAGSKITLGSLSTGYQKDSILCGLLASNAIAHYYLQHPLLSPDPIMLACRRMEIALDIISTMTVCSSHTV